MLDKLKSLSKDTLIYGTSTIVGRFLNFLLVPLYTNLFLPGEFGIVANVYAYIAILNVFFTIGLESGYFKFASTLEVGNKKQNFSHPFLGIYFNAFILSMVLFVFSKQFSTVFQISPARDILLKYTSIILFFDAIAIVPFAFLRLNHNPKKFALLKLLNIIINVVSNVVLIVFFKFGIEAVFFSNIAASVVTFIFLIPLVIENLDVTFNKKLFSELVMFSLPYIPAGISSNIVQVINRPILTALTNDSTVGIFQANYRLGIFMMLFVSMFEFAWRPFFLQHAKDSEAKSIFAKVMTIFVVVAALIFITLSFFINDIATVKIPFRGNLIGKAYWGGLSIVPIILLAYLFYGMYINLMAGIYIEKKTKYLPLITGIAAIVNVVFNFLLIPVMGMNGAAYTTLFSYLTMLVGIFIFSQKYYKIDYEYIKILLVFVSIILSYLILYIGVSFLPVPNIITKFISILVFVSLIFVFKIIDINKFKLLFHK